MSYSVFKRLPFLLLVFCSTFYQNFSQGIDARIAIDSSKINSVVSQIQEGDYGTIRSLLVYKHGELVAERYFNHKKDKYNPSEPHGLQSATKSINSLLVGILLDKGYIKSLDQKVVSFFPEYEITDPLKNSITIRDLLLMASGISWNEGKVDLRNEKENDLRVLNNSKDFIRYYLSKPMDTIPGAKFQYSGGCSITLGEIVKRASGMPVEEFANKFLLVPLGITLYKWESTSKTGQQNTGGGLKLLSKDLAKIGLMLANNGRWNDKQIISAQWIRDSFSPQIQTDRPMALGGMYHYGYQWWIAKFPSDILTISARGWGDQRLVLVPEKDLIIVTNAANFFDKPKKSIDDLLLAVIESN
jgi:CubicO group peptidase (beta-lactamase class C family)